MLLGLEKRNARKLPLGELTSLTTGTKPPDEILDKNGRFSYVNGGVTPSGLTSESNTSGETIVIPARGSVGRVGFQHEAFWCGPLGYRIESANKGLLSTRYLYHYLKSKEHDIIQLQQSGSIPALNKAQLSKFDVVFPDLQIQNEIVRILDTFTALEAELEAELRARQMQYAYYRFSLVDECNSELDGVRLGEICSVLNGHAFKSEHFNSEKLGLPLIRIRDINTVYSGTYYSGDYDSKYVVNDGDLLVGMDGDFNAIRWNGGLALLNQRVCRLQDFDDQVLPGFVYQFVRHAVKKIQSETAASTVKHLSSKQISDLIVPLPNLSSQRETVALLDLLDSLVNDSVFGLPAEIADRRKQFEHYRDKLLTFKELV